MRRRRRGRNCYNPVTAREEIGNPENPTILYPDSAKKGEEFRARTDLRNPSEVEEGQGIKHLLIVDGVRDGEKKFQEQKQRDSTERRRKEGREGGGREETLTRPECNSCLNCCC